jgi:hypothetical protein
MPVIIPLSTDEPVGSDTLPRGFCKYWDGLLIKANGRIHCGSDHGESHTIVDADLETADFVADVFNGPEFRTMRIRTALDNRAFHGQCRRCAAFRPLDPDFKADRRNPHYPELSALDSHAAGRCSRRWSEDGRSAASIDWQPPSRAGSSCTLWCPACLQGFDPGLLCEGAAYSLAGAGLDQRSVKAP